MKIINKNDENYTISIEVDKDFIDDMMDVVKILNIELCNKYRIKYQRNIFINFDQLIVRELWFRLTYLREGSVKNIIEEKMSELDEILLRE